MVIAGFVVFVVIFSLIVGLKKIRDAKKNLPVEDELSNAIKQKAAAMAYAFSFYIWVFILLFFSNKETSIDIAVGMGIIASGVSFIGFWIFYSMKGIDKQ